VHRLIFVTLLVGCSAAHPPPTPHDGPTPAPPAQMSVLMLQDGQDATLVAGGQGGFHIWLRYAVHGLGGQSVTLERTAHRVSDDAVVLRDRGPVDIGAPDADGWWTAPSPIPMFMCPTPIGISVIDVPIALELRLLGDADAELARAAVTVVPRCPSDGTQHDACTRICTG
jgi:hypothetical protein